MDIKEEKIKEDMKSEEIKNSETENKKEDATDEKTNEEIGNLKSEIEEKIKENEELNNMYLRLQADFINYKNRVEKEKESIYSYASEDMINSLLPVLDNFERALKSVSDCEDGFYKGMEMIYNQLKKVLTDNGLNEINALHEKFDPNYHHAAFQEESDEFEEGTVLEVFQKGYILKDKVIRPSMVKVSK